MLWSRSAAGAAPRRGSETLHPQARPVKGLGAFAPRTDLVSAHGMPPSMRVLDRVRTAARHAAQRMTQRTSAQGVCAAPDHQCRAIAAARIGRRRHRAPTALADCVRASACLQNSKPQPIVQRTPDMLGTPCIRSATNRLARGRARRQCKRRASLARMLARVTGGANYVTIGDVQLRSCRLFKQSATLIHCAVLILACGGTRPVGNAKADPELSPALAPLSWWLG